jgi:hypothetical protein
MSRDSGAEQSGQRTVAELLAQYGGDAPRNGRRRRRRAEEPSDTGPQKIIDRVNSESGPSRAVPPSGLPHPAPEAPPGPVARGRVTPRPPQAAPAPQEAAPDRAEQDAHDHWARRFATAEPRAGAPTRRPDPNGEPPPFDDAEATAQQPMLPMRPQSQPMRLPTVRDSPQIAIGPEPRTEQFSPFSAPPPPAPPEAGLPPARRSSPPHALAANPTTELFEADAPPRDELADYGAEELEADDAAVPADGLADSPDDEPDLADAPARGEWLGLALQVGVGVLGGAGVWMGFRWLWLSIPVAAVAAAVAVTGCLIYLARRSSHTDDRQTVLLAVLVGLACTVSPVAVMLVGQ